MKSITFARRSSRRVGVEVGKAAVRVAERASDAVGPEGRRGACRRGGCDGGSPGGGCAGSRARTRLRARPRTGRRSSRPRRGGRRSRPSASSVSSIVARRASIGLAVEVEDRLEQPVARTEVVVQRRRVALAREVVDLADPHTVDTVAGEEVLAGAQELLPGDRARPVPSARRVSGPGQTAQVSAADDRRRTASADSRRAGPETARRRGEIEPDPRFSFANERTFLAWIRTALGLITAGLVVTQLFPSFDLPGRPAPDRPPAHRPRRADRAVQLHRTGSATSRRCGAGEPLPGSFLPRLVAVVVSVVAVIGFVLVIVGRGSSE